MTAALNAHELGLESAPVTFESHKQRTAPPPHLVFNFTTRGRPTENRRNGALEAFRGTVTRQSSQVSGSGF